LLASDGVPDAFLNQASKSSSLVGKYLVLSPIVFKTDLRADEAEICHKWTQIIINPINLRDEYALNKASLPTPSACIQAMVCGTSIRLHTQNSMPLLALL
jgi:hypothetical protein